MSFFPARILIIHFNAPSKPYVSLCTIPVKGPINDEVGTRVLNLARKTIYYSSIPRLRDVDVICHIYELPLPYDREYFARHETVGEHEQFVDTIDDTFLKSRASLLSEEDVFRDARNALIIVYEVTSSFHERQAIACAAQKGLASCQEARDHNDTSLPLDVVYRGRAPHLITPFVGLYHSVFAKFIRIVATPPEQLDLTSRELELAHSLVSYSTPFCQNEDVLRHRVYTILRRAIDDSLHLKTIGAMRSNVTPTGVVHLELSQDSCGVYPLIVKLQKERREHGFDPADRAAQDYVAIHTSPENKPLSDISSCPALLMGIVGPRIMVSGAVYTDTLIIQDLHCADTLGLCATVNHRTGFDDAVYRAARLLRALREGVRELRLYYRELWSARGRRAERSSLRHRLPNPEHPHLRQFSVGTTTVKVDYVERLAGASPWRAVFKARIVNFDPPPSSPAELVRLPPMNRYVAIRFAHQYCADAHALLARQSPPLAPALWYCAHDPAVEMYVVVMEYIHGWHPAPPASPPPSPGATAEPKQWTGALRAAIAMLHEHGFVFGRLHEQNVFVRFGRPNEVRLVDFDWAGKVSEARYPSTISNRGTLKPSPWHPEVRRGGLIEKEHDNYLLDEIVSSDE